MLDSLYEAKLLSAQMTVAEIITKSPARCEIHPKSDTPKLGRCSLNLQTFREIVGVIRSGVQYFQKLQAEHQLAWFKVGWVRNQLAGCSLTGRLVFGVHVWQPMNTGRDVANILLQ